MQIKTILNRVQKFKSFVYGAVRWVEGDSVPTLEVELEPRSNSRPECSGWGSKGQATTGYPSGASSLFRCGATRCSLFMRHAGSSVQTAVSGWSGCPG